MKRLGLFLPLTILAGLYLSAWAAPLLAPYPPNLQFRDFSMKGSTPIRFRDRQGNWRRPFIEDYEPSGASSYRTLARPIDLVLLCEVQPYQWMGMTLKTRLFGLRDPSKKLFLLGADRLGRDIFSRVLHGARVSLTIGIAGVLLSAVLGTLLGAASGYAGGLSDNIVMRLADVVFALPALFMVMGVRAPFPLDLPVISTYGMIVLAFTLAGWATFARVIRGQVLSLKTQEFVLWSRACGASHWWVLSRHILPFTLNTVLVQSLVLIPYFILGEVTLSFLGVGVQPPDPSWGNILQDASSAAAVMRQPGLLSPAALLLLTVFSFNLLADWIKGVEKESRLL